MPPPANDPSVEASGGRFRTAAVLAVAVAAGLAARFLAGNEGPGLRTWLPVFVGVAVACGAIILQWWTPRWLGVLSGRYRRSVWLMPRLVIMIAAVLVIGAASGNRGTVPSCAESIPNVRPGDLVYSSVHGNTLICTYEDQGSSL